MSGAARSGTLKIDAPAPVPSSAPPGPALLNTYLVEDSPVIRDSLIATLEELVPVRVVGTAEDEATAVRWLAAPPQRVDLVIVDIFLRTGSGLGVLRAAQAGSRRFRLVVLSNYAAPEMRRTCQALGADRVFDKSTDIDALVAYCAHLAAGGDAAAPA
jgi:DNA-binding NarL/FixJ family response regulator